MEEAGIPQERGRGARMKPSHQRGAPGAGLRGGCCGVHVAEESLNLPQGDTATPVTHLGQGDMSGVLQSLVFHPHPTPLTFP